MPRFTYKLAILLLSQAFASTQLRADSEVDYNIDVRPILSDKCYYCHGPDEKNNKAGLRLDTAERAYATLKNTTAEFAIVPGDLEQSEIWHRINSGDPEEIMPPPDSNLKLTAADKDVLRRWIEQGAEYQIHWAFVPLPQETALPDVPAKNEIDRFVLAKLQEEKLALSPPADPLRWLRRVCLDLTGLPPTTEQIEIFRADLGMSPDVAYEKAVDALLASPAFGEHLAIDWLDASRYADTFGYHSDSTFTPWPYRDWVVKSFNENMPYDQFITWNLAGDLLPNSTREQKLATAYNRLNRITNEGGSVYLEFFVDGVSDRVHTVGTSLMALTMECTKCHDHKYDPITQKDYFSMFAFFNSINESGVYNHQNISPPPSLLLPTDDQEKDLGVRQTKVAELERKLVELRAAATPKVAAWLSGEDRRAPMPDQVGAFDFDKEKDPFKNAFQVMKKVKDEDGKETAQLADYKASLQEPVFVEGVNGTAVRLDGDRGIEFQNLFEKGRYTPFSVALWVKDNLRLNLPAMLAQRLFGHDVGYNGISLHVENGHLEARVFRSWPDNGIGVKTIAQIPKGEWAHITWNYDGSGRADGLQLFHNGELMETKVTGDQLYKSVAVQTYQSGHFMLGYMFRGTGFKGGDVDELRLFDRPLSTLEIKSLAGDRDLADIVAEAPAEQVRDYYLSAIDEEFRKVSAELADAYKAVTKREDSFLEIPVMVEMDEPRPAYVLDRGDYDAPRSKENQVERDTIGVLTPFPADAPRNRLGLAQWLTTDDHPLTSRVYVNRIWQNFFGQGIVATSENFGLQGDLPSHPKLLDWLSREFISSGWDIKALCRKIALSATYRQDSAVSPELLERDPDNLLLARGPAHRLSAEAVRDLALASSGLLQKKMGGGPVRPYDPQYNGSPKLDQVHRRSLYSYWRRTKPIANMIAFDMTSREVCVVKRSRTNSPTQALVLLNDIQFVEAARALATDVLTTVPDDVTRIHQAWLRVTGAPPKGEEAALLAELLTEQRAHFKTDPEAAGKLLKVGLKPAPEKIDVVEAAALTVVCQAILNTDAAIWKR